jgi:Cd2+/Zn2+-exporting ATPase
VIGAGVEGTAVMIFFRIGELFEEAAVQKTRHSISELVEMQPVSVRVVRDSKEMTVRPEDVAVGEHYIVLPGERIPIDGTVISGYSSLDTKAITGESMPKNVAPRESALSGCINVTGALAVKADRAYSDSAVARILDLIEESGAGKAGTENFITAFAKYYTSSSLPPRSRSCRRCCSDFLTKSGCIARWCSSWSPAPAPLCFRCL